MKAAALMPHPEQIYAIGMPETMSLFKTEHVHLGLSRCFHVPRGPSEEEAEPDFTVVFPMRGVFVHHFQHHRTVATPSMALLLNRDDVHQVSHPTGGNDESLFMGLSTGMVAPFLDRRGRLPRSSIPTRLSTFFGVRGLVQRAASGGLEGLDLEEFALNTLDDLLHGCPPGSPSPHHQDLVADAEEYLSVHFRDKSTLDLIAHQVGASPHHLSRLFRKVTGVSLSTRRTQLRLRFAATQIEDGAATDISRVAVEAGFYDHAHLTNTMRRHLGVTPRQIRAGEADHHEYPVPG